MSRLAHSISFPPKVFAEAALEAYRFGAAEGRFSSTFDLEDAQILVEHWEKLRLLQDRLEFCFHRGHNAGDPPESVKVAKAMIARREAQNG